jgi:phosphoglycolate phosphatase-like HAD superfamily hydrolase
MGGEEVKYNTFMFDFDFTLADATPGIVESVNYAFAKLEFEPQDCESIRRTVGMTLKNAFAQLCGTSDMALAEQFVLHFKDMADKVMAVNTVLFDDTIPTLTELKERGCKQQSSQANFITESTTHSWGTRSFQFRDPDGNILNFRSLPKEENNA